MAVVSTAAGKLLMGRAAVLTQPKSALMLPTCAHFVIRLGIGIELGIGTLPNKMLCGPA